MVTFLSPDRAYSANEILRNRKEWADYTRLRRNPEKLCTGCRRMLPNTEEFFATGMRGRVTSVCLDCRAANPAPTKVKDCCPLCRQFEKLIVDRARGGRVKFCYACLKCINHMAMLGPKGLMLAARYVDSGGQPLALAGLPFPSRQAPGYEPGAACASEINDFVGEET